MSYIAPGVIGSPQTVSVNTQYESDIPGVPNLSVFKFYGETGKKYMIGVETSDTQPAFNISDSVLYIYKPSNLAFTDSTYDYYNDDDYGPWDVIPPYDYSLVRGSRRVFTATETGWYVVIIVEYGTSF